MALRIWICAAFGSALYCSACSLVTAQADEATDVWLGQRLGWRVNVDADRAGHYDTLRRLSETLGVPIDVDNHSLSLLGIAQCQSYPVKKGEQPAIELLEWAAAGIDRDARVTFVVTEDEENRTPAAVRVLVLTRAALRRLTTIFPPNDSAAAEQVVAERLARSATLDAATGPLSVHLRRLSEAAGMPIELDAKSVGDGATPDPSIGASAGNVAVGELLAALLKQASLAGDLACYIADDAEIRVPEGVRIVVAARKVLESNPARFTPPIRRPISADTPEIVKLLGQRVTLKIDNERLVDAVGALTSRLGSRIDWDFDAIWRKEMDREFRVSLEATDKPLGKVLQTLLEGVSTPENQLVYAAWRAPAEGFKLVITSRKAAERKHWMLPDVLCDADNAAPAEKKD